MKNIVRIDRSKRLPKTYLGLVGMHVPRPIHDQTGYDNALEMVDALAGAALNEDQEDYLDLLSQVVENYERESLKPYPKMTGVEALRFLLEENGLSGDDLANLLKIDRSTAYKILKGGRNLTADHIRKLGDRFPGSADLFLS